jgi:Flp pilus assembly protein TadG
MCGNKVNNMYGKVCRVFSVCALQAPDTRRALRVARKRVREEQGAAVMEFALVAPLFFILVLGMYSFGILFNQYLQLTEAVNIGGQQLSVARNNYSDPCATVASYVTKSTVLSSANMTFTFNLAGTSYAFTKGATPTCTGGATTLTSAGPGSTVQLTVKYACNGALSFAYLFVNFNPLPASSCNLQSSISEISQ